MHPTRESHVLAKGLTQTPERAPPAPTPVCFVLFLLLTLPLNLDQLKLSLGSYSWILFPCMPGYL